MRRDARPQQADLRGVAGDDRALVGDGSVPLDDVETESAGEQVLGEGEAAGDAGPHGRAGRAEGRVEGDEGLAAVEDGDTGDARVREQDRHAPTVAVGDAGDLHLRYRRLAPRMRPPRPVT